MRTYKRVRIAGGCYFFTVVLAQRKNNLLVEQVDALREAFNLEKSVEREFIVQDIGFTVLSKNFSFTLRLSGHFLEVLWNQELALETVSK